jgi:hypothetical protein
MRWMTPVIALLVIGLLAVIGLLLESSGAKGQGRWRSALRLTGYALMAPFFIWMVAWGCFGWGMP